MDTHMAQAVVRFGLGRRGTEELPDDPAAWLAAQLVAPDPMLAAIPPFPIHTTTEGLAALREVRRTKPGPNDPHPVRDMFRADADAAIAALLTSNAPFRERLVWFWANHFTVSLKRGEITAVALPFIQEAIRPHVTGHFTDMLLAVMRHPAMLMYLDNAQSIGPESPVGLKQKRGLNENLARECLELHTVSPAARYTQADVTAFANILTGWSIELNQPPTGFRFRPFTQQPGPKTLMGQSFPPGEPGGIAALTWLSQHPATFHHLAIKLVRHFVADDPPPDAVARIEAVLRNSHGDLRAAALELTRLPQAWTPLTKLRSPAEFTIAALRALDLPADKRPDARGIMGSLGQPFLTAPLPNGWPDTAADWAGPEAMLRRVDWAFSVAGRAGGLDPVTVADASLGPLLPAATADQIRRAGSKREAFTLLLASPEFQRR